MDSNSQKPKTTKLLCSYGGRILPRYPDGKLRYNGGETRVLSVDRSISFSELLMKLSEMCGNPVTLRCQLPTEDLDALVSVTSDEDLMNLIEEYDRVSPSSDSNSPKIRAFLSGPKKVSPPSSNSNSPKSPLFYSARRCTGRKPPVYPVVHGEKPGVAGRHHYVYGNCGHVYLTSDGNHWQEQRGSRITGRGAK